MDSKSAALRDEYRLRFTKIERYRNRVWQILTRDFFSAYISPNAHVLDLGCGWGEFINNIHAAHKYAMDLNPDAQYRLLDEIKFIHQDCSQPWQLEPACLDVVFTSNFLEHLADKLLVEQTLSEAHRCLKPGGRMICLGPNIKYVNGEYWDFWDHFIPITDLSMAEVLTLQNFEIERSISKFLPYSMSSGNTPPLLLVQLYLKMPWAWSFLGKQFLIIARKR